MRRFCVRTLVTVVAVLVLLVGTGGGDEIPAKQSLSARYQFDVVRWEATHFLSKWWYRVGGLVLGRPGTADEQREAVQEYFALGEEVDRLQDGLEETRVSGSAQVRASLDELETRRGEIQSGVEETLEAELTAVLEELDIINKLGPLRWPPLDFTFEASPLVLVTSPRHEVRRLDDITLRPDVKLLDQEALEQAVAEAEDVTTLVVPVGGVATYPAHVSPTASLHGALLLASHEWLHHHLFFRPLGVRWFAGGALTSINETVANIAGEEIGDMAFTKITGQVVERESYQPPQLEPRQEPPPNVFDFRREMRATRLMLDILLDGGLVDETEVYLEERRQLFVANGFPTRKLNTAYFAFYGTYADSPASASPIEPQLQAVRADSANLAEFLDRVAGITSEGQLEQMALLAGWQDESEL
jgi:hypothetical protein